ncbi:LapA family protein [Chroococcidiopsis sp. CCMEE 29]|jgi:hypothetical protein|uniref:LapA family protein n=1 Tax=Chroococcidiopsis sp. CCMEE 29 TaxID=155894 RepID=UPI002020742A|nr:LapA family protein [Chroococcidiopsis sp. CCMEE 29]
MTALSNLLTSLILAIWVVAIAILSVQNATPVSLRFLNFQSIQLPVGLVLAFSAGVGLIGMSLTQPLWGFAGSKSGTSESDNDLENEFFSEDD